MPRMQVARMGNKSASDDHGESRKGRPDLQRSPSDTARAQQTVPTLYARRGTPASSETRGQDRVHLRVVAVAGKPSWGRCSRYMTQCSKGCGSHAAPLPLPSAKGVALRNSARRCPTLCSSRPPRGTRRSAGALEQPQHSQVLRGPATEAARQGVEHRRCCRDWEPSVVTRASGVQVRRNSKVLLENVCTALCK